MRELEKPVGRVFRRLRMQRFLTVAVWAWSVALFLVAVAIGVERLINRPLPGPDWIPFALAGAIGVLIAAVVAIFSGPSRIDAAVAIDRAFHLNERLSSALTLPTELRETPAGLALLADAAKRTADLDIGSAFGLRIPRRAWVLLIPAGLAVGLMFVPPLATRSAQAKAASNLDPKALAKKTEALAKKISSQRQAIDKDKFPEADKLLAQIEKRSEELAKAPPAQKDKLLVEMNKLSDALKERQKQLGSPEQVNRQLQQLKDMGKNGPADQLAKEMARGDFKKAADQLKQLQEKLRSGQMTQAEKKALQEQLGDMAKKLNDLANMEQRKKQLEEALKNGGLNKEQFEREMAKLNEQKKGLQQLQKLAGKLAEAQEALQKGDSQKAAEALGVPQEQLAQMAKQLDEMQALDGAMAELSDAKNGMGNDGLNQLGETLDGMGGMGDSMRRGMGNGMGRGRGQGDRPEAKDDTATYTTKVQQQFRKGKAVLQGFTQPSKTIKGESVIDIQGELDAATGSSADPLSNQRIPKNVEKHIRAYYAQINEGK